MCKTFLHCVKAALPVAMILISIAGYSQQEITADKNNTRPEITRQFRSPARIISFSAKANNGYNEIQWTAGAEQDTRKFVVEYTADGIYFQSAGEATATNGAYLVKHQTFDIRPLLYRIRMEGLDGKSNYSRAILLDGIALSPVKLYPTIISGNEINIVADFPIERITVFSGSGQQVFTKEIGGRRDYISVTVPSLAKGMYWMNFTGQGWKTTTRFIVP
jgi:hypothetical protein